MEFLGKSPYQFKYGNMLFPSSTSGAVRFHPVVLSCLCILGVLVVEMNCLGFFFLILFKKIIKKRNLCPTTKASTFTLIILFPIVYTIMNLRIQAPGLRFERLNYVVLSLTRILVLDMVIINSKS